MKTKRLQIGFISKRNWYKNKWEKWKLLQKSSLVLKAQLTINNAEAYYCTNGIYNSEFCFILGFDMKINNFKTYSNKCNMI